MILALVLAIFYPKKWQEPGSCHSSCHFAPIHVARTSSCHFQVARTGTCQFEDGKNQFLPHVKLKNWQEPVLATFKTFFQMARTGSCHIYIRVKWQELVLATPINVMIKPLWRPFSLFKWQEPVLAMY